MKRLSFLKRLAAASTRKANRRKTAFRNRTLRIETLDARQVMDGQSPTFTATIATQTVAAGAPLVVALNATDPDSGPLTFTVTSGDTSKLQATTPDSDLAHKNRFLKLSVAGYGDMVFELFEDKVPEITSQIIDIVQNGKWNNTIFHRLIADFMVQGGGENADGTAVSGVDAYDDQFSVDLMHTSSGLLSMAKPSTDDSNTTQFFITDGPTRWLDFNHSIFGKLVKGDDVRQAIMNVDRTGGGGVDSNDKPLTDIVITSALIYSDDDNGVVFLKAPEGVTGSTTVTVRVTDSDGNFSEQTFNVNIVADTDVYANSEPFLNPIPTVSTTKGSNAVFQLSSTDIEGDQVYYFATKPSDATVNYTVTQSNGLVTVTPPADFVGTFKVLVAVSSKSNPSGDDAIDTQYVTVNVRPAAPTLVLAAASDSGVSSSDGVTNATNLQFNVGGVTSGATVRLYRGDTLIEEVTASGTTVNFTTTNFDLQADGTYVVKVTQTVNEIDSLFGTYTLKIDRTGPVEITPPPPTTATATKPYSYDANNPEEGQSGFSYSLSTKPDGMSIDAATGVITWTPTAQQAGTQTYEIRATDAAGNQRVRTVTVNVADAPLAQIILRITDDQGNPLTSVSNGDSFELRVYTKDLSPSSPNGLYSSYMDIEWDALFADLVGDATFGTAYPGPSIQGTRSAGLIDEIGSLQGSTFTNSSGELLLFKQTFTAKKSGTFTISSNQSEDDTHDTTANPPNSDAPIPNSRIDFGSVTVTVDSTVTAVADTFNVDEDSTSQTLSPLANDTVTTGTTDGLTISEVGTGDHGGTITISDDHKTLIYTPAANFNGAETFTYTVQNTDDSTSTATITVQVHPINDAPVANDDTFSAEVGDVDDFINVLANDTTGPDADETLRILSVSTGSAGGTLTIAPGGTNLFYSPKAGFTGTETFTYTITDRSDSTGLTATANLTITVANAGVNPIAAQDTITIQEDSTATTINVLDNDSAGVNDSTHTLTIKSVQATTTSHGGTVTISADQKTITYTPAPNFQGVDEFIYTMQDASGATANGTVKVTVQNVNDNPTATDDSLTVAKNQANQTLNVLANDSSAPDPLNSETLTITAITQGAHGTVAISSDNKTLLYTPADGYSGEDTFTYTISDGNGGTATASVTVNVLDFIPSKITGRVFFDANHDGLRQSGEVGIAGIQIHLVGTSQFDADGVDLTVTTDALGRYTFDQLPPGAYTITQTAMSGLSGMWLHAGTLGGSANGNSLSVDLGQGVESLYNDFMYAPPRQVFATSLFASAGRSGFVAAVAPGASGHVWTSVGDGWAGYTNVKVTLPTTLDFLIVNASDPQGTAKTANLDLTNAGRVRAVSQAGSLYTFQVIGTAAQIFGSTSGSGEPGSSTTTRSAGTASGEPGSANLAPADAALLSYMATNSTSSTESSLAKTRSLKTSPLTTDYFFASHT